MDIYNLLGIGSEALRDFPLLAGHVMDLETERRLNRSLRKLEEINDATLTDARHDVPKDVVDQVLKKVITAANKENAEETATWTVRELRIVSYYLKRLRSDNPHNFRYALSLLDKHWRDMYFKGLTSFLLSSWNEIEPDYRKEACELLRSKLGQYKGNVQRYVRLQNHASFFDEAGPMRMAALLIAKGKDISSAPAVLGYRSTTLNLSYYSDVVLRYVKRQGITDAAIIDKILERHGMDRTKKLLIVWLVEQAEASGDALKRAQLCKFIHRVLGDVTVASYWAPFPGATQEEAQQLRLAMEQVHQWLTQEAIEAFFDICVQDNERKRFWLDYTSYVSRFKIVGSLYMKHWLQSDPRIGSVVSKHFITTKDRPQADTSALVLFIRDKMIVEFSDVGSVYVYGSNDGMVNRVLRYPSFISWAGNLKRTTVNNLVRTEGGWLYFLPNGRLVHKGDWQYRLRKWMEKVALATDSTPFAQSSSHDGCFVEQPLEPEDEIEQ